MKMPQINDAKDLGKCPCGGCIAVDMEKCAVIHAVPICKDFAVLEPDEFLAFVRRSRGLPNPHGVN
jgi:hypothetical protein